MLLTHPHRLASSELERLLYISNDSRYNLIFKREEPGIFHLDHNDESELNLSKPNPAVEVRKDFIQTQRGMEAMAETNRRLFVNQIALLDEIKKLNAELGYTEVDTSLKEFIPKLEPIEGLDIK